ncbi:MAG: DUF2764 family protein [Kiritimatiellae bacterium]|nr:DUF2764 family protein [Kiritimatiellia bacterium]
MSIDYTVASLPSLYFGQPAPLSSEEFAEICGEETLASVNKLLENSWRDLDAQLKNALASCRAGERDSRPVDGCSIYWKNRVISCYNEKDIMKRQMLLDRVWWDAAEELVELSSPLGIGALAAYSVRLEIALRHSLISSAVGISKFDSIIGSEISGLSVQVK